MVSRTDVRKKEVAAAATGEAGARSGLRSKVIPRPRAPVRAWNSAVDAPQMVG